MEMAAIWIGSNCGPVQEVKDNGDDGEDCNKSSLTGYSGLDFMKGEHRLVLVWFPMRFLLVSC
jgi:hypothetical protein